MPTSTFSRSLQRSARASLKAIRSKSAVSTLVVGAMLFNITPAYAAFNLGQSFDITADSITDALDDVASTSTTTESYDQQTEGDGNNNQDANIDQDSNASAADALGATAVNNFSGIQDGGDPDLGNQSGSANFLARLIARLTGQSLSESDGAINQSSSGEGNVNQSGNINDGTTSNTNVGKNAVAANSVGIAQLLGTGDQSNQDLGLDVQADLEDNVTADSAANGIHTITQSVDDGGLGGASVNNASGDNVNQDAAVDGNATSGVAAADASTSANDVDVLQQTGDGLANQDSWLTQIANNLTNMLVGSEATNTTTITQEQGGSGQAQQGASVDSASDSGADSNVSGSSANGLVGVQNALGALAANVNQDAAANQNANNDVEASSAVNSATDTNVAQLSNTNQGQSNQTTGTDDTTNASGTQNANGTSANDATIEQSAGSGNSNYNASGEINNDANGNLGALAAVTALDGTEVTQLAGDSTLSNQEFGKTGDTSATGNQNGSLTSSNTQKLTQNQGDVGILGGLSAAGGANYNAAGDLNGTSVAGLGLTNGVTAASTTASAQASGNGDLINQTQGVDDLVDADSLQVGSAGANNNTDAEIDQQGEDGQFNADLAGTFGATTEGEAVQGTTGLSTTELAQLAGDDGNINQEQGKWSDVTSAGAQETNFLAGNTTTFLTQQGAGGLAAAANGGNYNASSEVDADSTSLGGALNNILAGSTSAFTQVAGQGDQINQTQGVDDTVSGDGDQNIGSLAGNVTGVGIFQNDDAGQFNADSDINAGANSDVNGAQAVAAVSNTELGQLAGDGGNINQDQAKNSDVSGAGDQTVDSTAGNTTTAVIEQGNPGLVAAAGNGGNFNASNNFGASAGTLGSALHNVSVGSQTVASEVAGQGDQINQAQDVADVIDADSDQSANFAAGNNTIGSIQQVGDAQYNADQAGEFGATAGGEVLQGVTGYSNTDLAAAAGDGGNINQDQGKSSNVDVNADQSSDFTAGNTSTFVTEQGTDGLAAAAGAGNYNAASEILAQADSNGFGSNNVSGGSQSLIQALAGTGDQINQEQNLDDAADVSADQSIGSLGGNVNGIGIFQAGDSGQYNADALTESTAHSGVEGVQQVLGGSNSEMNAVAGNGGNINQDQGKSSDTIASGDQTADSTAGNTNTTIIEQGSAGLAAANGGGSNYNATADFGTNAASNGSLQNGISAASATLQGALAGQGDQINQSQDTQDVVEADGDQNGSLGAANQTVGLITQAGDSQYNADQTGNFGAETEGQAAQQVNGLSDTEMNAVAGDGGNINQNQWKGSDVAATGAQGTDYVSGNTTTFITQQGEDALAAANGGGSNYNALSNVDADSGVGANAANAVQGGSASLLQALAGQGDQINQSQGVNDAADVGGAQGLSALAGNVTGVGVFQAGEEGQFNAETNVEAGAGVEVGANQATTGVSDSTISAVAGDGGNINQDQGKISDIAANGTQGLGAVAGNTTTAVTEQGDAVGALAAAANGSGNYNAVQNLDADAGVGGGAANAVTGVSNSALTALAGNDDQINQWQGVDDTLNVDGGQNVLLDAENDTAGAISQSGDGGQYNADQGNESNASAGGQVAQATNGVSDTTITAVGGDDAQINQDALKTSDIGVASDQDAGFFASNNTTLQTQQGDLLGGLALNANGGGNYNATNDAASNAAAAGSSANTTNGVSGTAITQVAGSGDENSNQSADLTDNIDVDSAQTTISGAGNTNDQQIVQSDDSGQFNADVGTENNAVSDAAGVAATNAVSDADITQVAGDNGLANEFFGGEANVGASSAQDVTSTANNTNNLLTAQGDVLGGLAAAANSGNANATGDVANNAGAVGTGVEAVNAAAALTETQVTSGDEGAIESDYEMNVGGSGDQGVGVGSSNSNTAEQLQDGQGDQNADYNAENNSNAVGTGTQAVNSASNVDATKICAGLVCALRDWIGGTNNANGSQDVAVESGNSNDIAQEQSGEGNANLDANLDNDANATGAANQGLNAATVANSTLICDDDVEVCAIGSTFETETTVDGSQNLDVIGQNTNNVEQVQGDGGLVASNGGGQHNADADLNNNVNSDAVANQAGNSLTQYNVLHDCGGAGVCAAGAWVRPTTRTTLGQNSNSTAANTNTATQEQNGSGNANQNIDANNDANATNTANQNANALTQISGAQLGCAPGSLCAFSAVVEPTTEAEGNQNVNSLSQNNSDLEQEYEGDGQKNQNVDVNDSGSSDANANQAVNANTVINWVQDCGGSTSCGQSFDENSNTNATGTQNVTSQQQNNTTVKQKGGAGNQSANGNSTSNATANSTNNVNSGNNISIIQQ